MHDNTYAKGLAITGLGGFVLTFDIALIRLADGDVWPMLMVKSGGTFIAGLAVYVALRLLGQPVPALVPGRAGMIVSAFYAISAVCFILAVYNTTTANLVFILALNPMLAALMGWVFLGERPRMPTLVTLAVMLAGVVLIVEDGIAAGNWVGDLMSFLAAASIAGAITVSRASGRDMGFTPLVSAIVPALAAAVMTAKTGYRIEVPFWILLNGFVVIPLSFFCLANGPKWLPGPQVAMFYLLETVLAPVWVWMIFAERPSDQSLAGGAILIGGLLAHSLWQLRAGRRRARSNAPRHPA